jgi:hypothetical protein
LFHDFLNFTQSNLQAKGGAVAYFTFKREDKRKCPAIVGHFANEVYFKRKATFALIAIA